MAEKNFFGGEPTSRPCYTAIEHWAMPHRMMHELQIKLCDLRLAHWVFMMLGNLLGLSWNAWAENTTHSTNFTG